MTLREVKSVCHSWFGKHLLQSARLGAEHFTSWLVASRAVSPERRPCPLPETPSTNCSTGSPRYLRGDTARRCSPRLENLLVRCGSSLTSNANDGSCDGYPGPPSPPMRSTALISVSSAFLAVTTMSRKSSLYNQINLSHRRGRLNAALWMRSAISGSIIWALKRRSG